MKKTLQKLFGGGSFGALDVGYRGAAWLFALMLGVLAPLGVEGYQTLGPERVLLMNADDNAANPVSWQEYGNTSSSNPFYWKHSTEATGRTTAYLKAGVYHTFYRNNGDGTETVLWQLNDCRAGSATLVNDSRNYISWSATARSIVDDSLSIPVPSSGVASGVGSIIMRQSVGASIVSPAYEQGVGTIYFDAVNALVAETNHALRVLVSTNTVTGADLTEDSSVEECKWNPVSVDSLTLTKGARNSRVVAEKGRNLTAGVLNSVKSKDGQFFRFRCRVFEQLKEWRGPVRFKIIREEDSFPESSSDSTGIILVDNIEVSYPPMTVEMHQPGEYDDSLKNAEVSGYVGTFSTPFLSVENSEAVPRAYFTCLAGYGESVTNVAEQFSVSNAQFYYRWRYLNQQVGEWKGPLPMTVAGTNLIGTTKMDLPGAVGDVEYYFTYEQNAPCFKPVDYAAGHMYGYGVGWTEVLTNRIYRADYPDETPACGHDFFTRIRESESPYEWVKLCTSVTTNGTEGVVKEDVRMELVNTNTWRYCYYVPTNAVGETLRFHFEGKKLAVDPDDAFKFIATTNTWKCDLKAVPYLPYTSVAGEEYANDVAIVLDNMSTHLIIEFNDEMKTYSMSHGTYQNFNAWTDAMQGYRGNAKYDEENPTNGASATGVADTKQKFVASMANWPLQGYTDPFWTEDFNSKDHEAFPRYQSFDTSITPLNGWEAGHGQWIAGARGSAAVVAVQEEAALQMEGRGQGYVALDKDSNMPPGIGTVSFGARVAQTPRFDDFAVYGDGSALTDYAISAKLTMSRQATADWNPTDISPSQPSVSLIGYYREKKGCYEYRITRVASDQLCCALYKWLPSGTGMTATMIASNVITSASSSYAKPGPGQTAISGFNNMLVPNSKEAVNAAWTSAYMFLFNKGDGSVYIECMLSNTRTSTGILNETRSNQKKVLVYTDSSSPLLKGSYGVGSTDCNAGFGGIQYHLPADAGNYAAGINYAGTSVAPDISGDDWAFYLGRWNQPKSTATEFGMGSLNATMPTNQTIRLQFKDDANGWFDSGYEAVITSYSTNRYEFAPCVSPDYKVRLITGGHTYDEVRTDVVVDDIEITAWRAADFPTLSNVGTYAQADQWVYTAATLESSAEIVGPGTPTVGSAGTNGYAFAFTVPGVYRITPTMDMEIDRLLLVGGGGAGGNVMGGGGGGGEVKEFALGTNGITVVEGKEFVVTVGGGGAADTGNNQNAGKDGGTSSILVNGKTYSVKGGGGGGGWSSTAGRSGASGGGASNQASGGAGTAGFAGGNGSNGRGGGGGGAGEKGGDYTLGTTTANGSTAAARNTQNAYGADGGKGGDGVANDITGEEVYYGGGGGGGSGWSAGANYNHGGDGGKGGGGRGADAYNSSTKDKVTAAAGTDGLGGGGGGGGGWVTANTEKASRGAKGGSGAVILHTKSASKVCTLQPARGTETEAMGLRSPYLGNGISMFSFSYANADTNCVLLLQACLGTNGEYSARMQGRTSMSVSLTREPPVTNNTGNANWVTLTNFTFKGLSAKDLASGSCAHYMSLRAPVLGFLRLVVAPQVIETALADEGVDRNVDYGKITITGIYCYDEPALDRRSWWGWNMHTEGWNTDDKQYAYLFDSPDGLSASLNFSSKKVDNESPDARGIGLSNPELEKEYAANNSFVQCPPLTNGLGTVTFRARTFTTNQVKSSYVTLWGSSEPDSDQISIPEDWKELQTFEITNTTYQTYKWSTTDDNTKIYAIRLEVNGSRHGRTPGAPDSWEKPRVTPIQRVWIDEITASEPIVPRLVFRDVRPFRSHIGDIPAFPVTNVTDLSEQPILGESWGVQATVEPQQMSDELKADTVKVYAAFYRGISPWGYDQWKDKAGAIKVELEQVASNLVFRSTYNNSASVIGPDMTPNGVFPNNVWQYYLWAEYEDKQGVQHVHGLDSTEWQPPTWFYGIKDLNEKYGSKLADKFSGYTILDSISPNRAWLNEVNICDTGSTEDYKNQFIEIAVPQGADLTDWRIDLLDRNIKRGSIARFGSGNAQITTKTGSRMGVDVTNHYTFVALRSPKALESGLLTEADGSWQKTPKDETGAKDVSLSLIDGCMRYYEAYGLALVRPSGVIEHQIVFQGTNTYLGGPLEYLGSATNLLAKVKEKGNDGPDSHWFYAGLDMVGGTLGVFRSHGEDETCWTNKMIATVSALNKLENGKLQNVDPDWFLQPNGTNVWIYANVYGDHIHQTVGQNTNNTAVVIIRKGGSTNIVYKTDAWYQIGEVTTNGVTVAGAQGRGSRTDTPAHTWTLELKDVEATVTVNVNEERSKDVADAKLDPTDPYYPAIMSWLTSLGDDLDGLHLAEQWDLGNVKTGELDIKDMYWLNIDPTQDGWVLKAGMGGVGASTTSASAPSGGASLAAVAPVPYEDTVYGSLTNVQVLVTMMITNRVTKAARAPDMIQGLEPGSNSYDYDGKTNNWTSATFKICGALQREGVKDSYYPLRWFVFGPDSFDANFQSKIEVSDPHSKSSPGYYNGWNDYPDIPIFYKWKLNADPANYDTTEMLKADSTYP